MPHVSLSKLEAIGHGVYDIINRDYHFIHMIKKLKTTSSNYRKYYLYLQAIHPTPSLGTCLICISCSQTHALIQFCILEICVQFNEELHIELNDGMTLTERSYGTVNGWTETKQRGVGGGSQEVGCIQRE